MHPANKLCNLRRRVDRAAKPHVTCPASRHVDMMADALSKGEQWWSIHETPEYGARAMWSVVESLWKARARIHKLEAKIVRLEKKAGIS